MAKMGRPEKPFDWQTLNKYLQFKPSLSDTADLMDCSEDTLQNKIKEKYNVTFSVYRDKKMSKVRLTLTQKAIQMANAGDRTLLIFCLKNYCNWTDNVKAETDLKGTVSVTYNVVKLKPKEIKQVKIEGK